MQYVTAVQAALRATAPFVAIPVEGHAPACVRGKLLKGALKGVTITSVKIITADPASTSDSGRWLEIKGLAEGGVRTTCKIVVCNVKSYEVWKELSRWTDRERDKRIKTVSQGILSAAERKALKLEEARAREEKARNAALIAAKREEAEIIAEAKQSVFPEIIPVEPETRQEIIAGYSEFRKCRHVRKRGSVIRWKLKTLREQVAAMTTEKREYEERPRISPFARPRRTCIAIKKVLRHKKDAIAYAALAYQIGQLEAQFKALYPTKWRAYDHIKNSDGTPAGIWVDSFPHKRPKALAYKVPWGWSDGCIREGDEDGTLPPYRLSRLAERLREAREDIRALTPPPDEDEEEMPVAA